MVAATPMSRITIREMARRLIGAKYRALIRIAMIMWMGSASHSAGAEVTLPFRLVEPDLQVQLRVILQKYGIPLCRALHPLDADRCRYSISSTDVIEVRGLDDLGSSHSILGAVIDTDRLSVRNGLPPVTLTDFGSPIFVQSAAQAAWEGDTILGRPVRRIVVIQGSGDLANDKIRLIEALVRSVGTSPHRVAPAPAPSVEGKLAKDEQGNAGQLDVYFGMPW